MNPNPLKQLFTSLGANLPTVLGAVGTLLGIIGTLLGTVNTQRLDSTKFKYQTDATFATAIENVEPKLSTRDAGGNSAAVAFVSLYAQAETVLQKLELIELAQTAKQNTAMVALAGIGSADQSVQKPSTDEVLPAAAIKVAITNSGSATISQLQAQPQVTTTIPAPGTKSQTQLLPTSDPPVTQSRDPAVRSNAALIAALPAGVVSGWTFVGDASGPNRHDANAELDTGTTTISATHVPAAGTIVTACLDLNIRVKPFENGVLGQIIGIATRGDTLKVDANMPLSADGFSVFDKARPIAAKWIHVTVQHALPSPSTAPSKC